MTESHAPAEVPIVVDAATATLAEPVKKKPVPRLTPKWETDARE